ncbi:MAG TPA: AbrB family transcriptional regulator [Oculatellaceae cyanobacterium]
MKLANFFNKLNKPYLLVSVEIILALLIGFSLLLLGIGGGAWILGGIIAGALVFYLYRSLFNNKAEPNRNSRKIGQIIIGLTIGFSIKNSNFANLSSQLPIFLSLASILIFSGVIIGIIYSRIEKTDLLTALLATIPGNIGIMASVAADYGKNTAIVSLVQLIRFTLVILIAPIIANVSNHHDISNILSTFNQNLTYLSFNYLSLLILVLFLAYLGVETGKKLKIPVAAFFCPIIVGIGFQRLLYLAPFLPDINFNLPPLLNLIGQVLLGITIGEYWAVNPSIEKRSVAYTSIPVALTFIAALISAGIAMVFTPWDWLTCLLVTSPGGSPEMILISLALHRNVEIVTTGHLVRLMAINFSLPVLVSLVRYWEDISVLKKEGVLATKLQDEN